MRATCTSTKCGPTELTLVAEKAPKEGSCSTLEGFKCYRLLFVTSTANYGNIGMLGRFCSKECRKLILWQFNTQRSKCNVWIDR